MNERSNQLAFYLRKLGVTAETLVALYVDRSLNMIVGIMGILKAGGAYVPLDPKYPKERLTFILEDISASVILTEQNLIEKLPDHKAKVICLDADWKNIKHESNENPVRNSTADNLAYVIYTSGSTGRPKGTLLQHRGLCNFATAHVRSLGIDSNSRWLQFASSSFDASVSEIFTAFMAGGTLYLARQETILATPNLLELLEKHQINTAIFPPSLLSILPEEKLQGLQTVISAGENLPVDVAAKWANGRKFFNGYGPTEATVGPMIYRIEQVPDGSASLPIGKPLDNIKAYILDKNLIPVPVGIPCELHIGGVELARGYLNRPDLTADKFIPNPFNDATGGTAVQNRRPGRYLPDGNIDFLGRIDHQVKIRGFRIELGEIESLLHTHPAIATAVVLAREDKLGDRRLIAYYVPDSEVMPEPTTSQLYEYLKEKLPEYMVPSIFMKLDRMPLTPNGKIDRKSLPAPDQGRPELGKVYVAPRTPTEELLTGIMAQVLGVDRVEIYDSFFELGGHSLLGVRVQSRIRDTFQIELPLHHIFEAPTIAELAPIVERNKLEATGLDAPPIKPIPRNEELPLSFAQQRLWFLDQLEPNTALYNIPDSIHLRGKLNISLLNQCLNEIIKRHEVLRTSFETVDGQAVQRIISHLTYQIPVIDLIDISEIEKEDELHQLAIEEHQRPFQLTKAPLFRAKIIRLAEDDHVVLFTMHHIISDGWSSSVFISEMASLYDHLANGKSISLPELKIQYADYAFWQREYLKGEVLDKQLSYWKNQLDAEDSFLELPTDRPRPAVQSSRGALKTFALPAPLSTEIKMLGQKEEVTLFMTLLAAFQTLLHRYTGQEYINVGTPISNRTRSETEQLIGFFVNTLVLRTSFTGNPRFSKLLSRVKETTLNGYAHQDVPFEKLVDAIQPQRNMSHSPLFQVMFVLQNAHTMRFELPALTLSSMEAFSGVSKFDLTLYMVEEDNQISGAVEYNIDLFNAATIDRFIVHFQNFLAGMVAEPNQRVLDLPILDNDEKHQLISEWNDTKVDIPNEKPVYQLFEE